MKTLLTHAQLQSYHTHGFLHLKNAYNLATIEVLRKAFEEDYLNGGWQSAPYFNEGITTNIYKRMPQLVPLLFNEYFMQAIKELFGNDTYLLPEPAVHKNRYYYWHKDSTFLDEQKESFHWDENFNGAMTVVYLQENDPRFGGGLTVIPGSHKLPDRYWKIPEMNLLQRATLKLKKLAKVSFFDEMDQNPNKYFIPGKLGDLIILDMRIDHKGSPCFHPNEVPYNKYGIMNIACAGKNTAKRISACLRKRPSKYYQEYLKNEKAIEKSILDIAHNYNVNVML
jgi:hypothetical protein